MAKDFCGMPLPQKHFEVQTQPLPMSILIPCHSFSTPHTKPLWSSHTKEQIISIYVFQASFIMNQCLYTHCCFAQTALLSYSTHYTSHFLRFILSIISSVLLFLILPAQDRMPPFCSHSILCITTNIVPPSMQHLANYTVVANSSKLWIPEVRNSLSTGLLEVFLIFVPAVPNAGLGLQQRIPTCVGSERTQIFTPLFSPQSIIISTLGEKVEA